MTNSEVLKMREKLDNLTDAIDNIDNFVFLKTNEDNVKQFLDNCLENLD